MLECPNCKNYGETASFRSSNLHLTCPSCKCRFSQSETGGISILYRPLPHIILVIFALIEAFSLAAYSYNKIYFQLFMCVAFFINIYYAWKLKIVYGTKKICLLSKELSSTELAWAVGVILINIGGFIIFAYALFNNINI